MEGSIFEDTLLNLHLENTTEAATIIGNVYQLPGTQMKQMTTMKHILDNNLAVVVITVVNIITAKHPADTIIESDVITAMLLVIKDVYALDITNRKMARKTEPPLEI